jgi:hypothetical protein
LHENIGACEEFEGFEGRALRAEDTLAALDEAFLVADLVSDFDDVACDAVFENFQSLDRSRALAEVIPSSKRKG